MKIIQKFNALSILLTFCATIGVSSVVSTSRADETAPQEFGGVYPRNAFFNDENECGTGAVVAWANRLWAITYGPHLPNGSSDKLYEIDDDLNVTIRPESVGGTNANRMIHRESNQLFIGNHVIDAEGGIRTIPHAVAPGRVTAVARGLKDAANKVYWLTMEEGLYEIDVNTLEAREIYKDGNSDRGEGGDVLPGYHGKGGYTSQGRVVYANNGEQSAAAQQDPTTTSGCLAEWFGEKAGWRVVERKQFTEVTTSDGIYGGLTGEEPLWTLGWDAKSVILEVLDGGEWRRYRMPKASHCYDGAHGWNTEWPRIRKIDDAETYLATMHGQFWRFPKSFSHENARGVRPRSTYLKVIGDFEYWNGRVVFGCDDSAKSEFLNKSPFKNAISSSANSNSNLWFVSPERLDSFGPALGRGALWLNESVKAGEESDSYLFAGYDRRSCYFKCASAKTQDGSVPQITLEYDALGNDDWQVLADVVIPQGAEGGEFWRSLDDAPDAEWIRVRSKNADLEGATFVLQYRNEDMRATDSAAIFNGLATAADVDNFVGARFWTRGDNRRLAVAATIVDHDKTTRRYYELSEDGDLEKVECRYEGGEQGTLDRLEKMVGATPIDPEICAIDDKSVLLHYRGAPYRLPIGSESIAGVRSPMVSRLDREVVTERDLFHVAGTFYELPAENAGGVPKIRPISTSDKLIVDYASYRGLLVLSGIVGEKSSGESERIARSEDGVGAVWRGVIDDLWSLGKARGQGAVWKETKVAKDAPSDPMLATGYDRKTLELANASEFAAKVDLEADITGDGDWIRIQTYEVPARGEIREVLPTALQAYWFRLRSQVDATLSGKFIYD